MVTLLLLASMAAGCRIDTVAPDGGDVSSRTGERDCLEGQRCLFDSTPGQSFSDTFTAVPREGYQFLGWRKTDENPYLCGDSTDPCILENVPAEATDLDITVGLSPLFSAEGNIFYPGPDAVTVCTNPVPTTDADYTCEIKNFSDYGYGELEEYVLTNTNLVYDQTLRKAELAQLSTEVIDQWCNADRLTNVIDYASYIATPPSNPDDNPPFPGIFEPLVFGRVHYLYLGNMDAGTMILNNLLEWSRLEVDLWIDLTANDNSASAHYQLGLLMPAYIQAWDAVREAEFISDEQRAQIDLYLHKLMRILAAKVGYTEGVYYATDNITNHAWSQDYGLMLYGIFSGNDILFQRGVARFFSILDGMVREDGSHIYESQRGGSALLYSLSATDMMLRIAEAAANQGYDLYSVEVNGISVHDVIDFHARAVEDESLLYPYTSFLEGIQDPNYCENPSQCENWNNMRYSDSNPGGYRYQGWPEFESYKRRFPDSNAAMIIRALYPDEQYNYLAEGPFAQVCEFRPIP